MPVASRDVRAVQACYPRIYLACHIQHLHRTAARANLTETESSLLAHLDEEQPIRASELARHMGVSRSSMSATIKRLMRLGYIASAMQAGSVLDTGRVAALLARLSPADRKKAIEGLGLLARAADQVPRQGRLGVAGR